LRLLQLLAGLREREKGADRAAFSERVSADLGFRVGEELKNYVKITLYEFAKDEPLK